MRPFLPQRVYSICFVILTACTAALAVPAFAQSDIVPATPPVARKVPKVDLVHGDQRQDDYFWLREKTNPEVIAYLEAENAYTRSIMKPTEEFQEALYKEILGRIKETDLSVPVRRGGWFYYQRTEQGKQYPIMCRKKGTLEAAEQVTLDLNKLAEGHEFLGMGAYNVSDDGRLLAYSLDFTGFRQYQLFIKDLDTGKVLSDSAMKTGSVAWAADNKTLFYSVENDAKRHYQIWRHQVGETSDALVYEEKDEMFNVGVSRSRSKEWLFLEAGSLTSSEVRYLKADQPGGEWKMLAAREKDHEYDVDHRGDLFYIRTNSGGRNFRLVTAPVSDPRRESWKEIIPHRADVMLEGANLFADWMVLSERQEGLPQITVTDLRTRESHRISFPEPAYAVFMQDNPEFATTTLRYNYQSHVTPGSVYDYDLASRKATLLKQNEVVGGYDSSKYKAERMQAIASDGTRIPISLVYKKDTPRDGSAPMLLYAYGSYGFAAPVTFSSNRLSLLDRGMIFAVAHIRGGGEMGKAWHDQGRMLNKKNTFTDFIACAEHLVKARYTSPGRLVIQGGSAGGLLMGAVTNLRPDLFKAVVSQVPFVDVINTMLDESVPLTVAEFEEWGNPKIKAEYDYMKAYCPYSNLASKSYPAVLVETSLNDSQVMYWEPAKYVARMRAVKAGDNPLLLKTNMGAGHGGASGRYDRLRETAFDYAFILSQAGLFPATEAAAGGAGAKSPR